MFYPRRVVSELITSGNLDVLLAEARKEASAAGVEAKPKTNMKGVKEQHEKQLEQTASRAAAVADDLKKTAADMTKTAEAQRQQKVALVLHMARVASRLVG